MFYLTVTTYIVTTARGIQFLTNTVSQTMISLMYYKERKPFELNIITIINIFP